MANKTNKKTLQKQNEYWRKQNKVIYVRMRELEAKLDAYEKNVAAQVSELVTRYEDIICYIMDTHGIEFVLDDDVAEWAKDKLYCLKASGEGTDSVAWMPKIVGVEDEPKTEVWEPESDN